MTPWRYRTLCIGRVPGPNEYLIQEWLNRRLIACAMQSGGTVRAMGAGRIVDLARGLA